jgi:hypothetical protein
MPVLILRNHNPNATLRQLRFDVKTGQFLTKNKTVISRDELTTRWSFTHPILEEASLVEREPHHYVYRYQNEIELCLVLRSLYATLLQSNNPALCSFQIQPTEQYLNAPQSYTLYFSSHAQKKATQKLKINPINAMLSDIYETPFYYADQIILDQILTWVDLPRIMDADKLYQPTHLPSSLVNHQEDLDRCELRYINRRLCFGLFARDFIPKGTKIGQYCGQYTTKNVQYKNYSYMPEKNSGLNLPLDAKHRGNLTRFLNHAPKYSEEGSTHEYLAANIGAENHEWYGMRRIIFIAERDILAGEQLLFSYGDNYFRFSEHIFNLKKNGTVVDHAHRVVYDNYSQLKPYLLVFAQFGVRYAQWALLRKPVFALLVCGIIGCWMQYLK